MARHVLLNNVDHRDLKINTARSEALGDNVMFTLTFPLEFKNIQAHFPIVFSKDASSGKIQPVALFGFEKNENLFLGENGWAATYLPLTLECRPFLIGVQRTTESGFGQNLVVHIDMDSPRVSTVEGESVFLEQGGHSKYLDRINSVLKAIYDGLQGVEPFVDMLLEFDLLEPFTFDITLNDGSTNRLLGFYTINEDRLNKLNEDALGRLHSKGFLTPLYMVIASTNNFRALIELKNRQLKKEKS